MESCDDDTGVLLVMVVGFVVMGVKADADTAKQRAADAVKKFMVT